MDQDNRRKTLVLEDKDVKSDLTSAEIERLSELYELLDYISENCKDVDLFDVYMHGQHADQMVESSVWEYPQVKRVNFSYDSTNDMEKAKQKFGSISNKFHFCLKNEVANRIQNNHTFFDLISKLPQSQKSLQSSIEEHMYRLRMKQQNLTVSGIYISPIQKVGFNARNIETIGSQFLCVFCSYILRDPVQLYCCGDRLCKSCVENWKGETIKCPECHTETDKKDVMLDRGFKNDMRMLNIICSHCEWNGLLKDYESHLDQVHPIPICEYCHEMFESFEHLRVHQMINCHMIIEPCLLEDYGCSNTVNRLERENHYLTEKHQHALSNAIRHLSNNVSDIQHENDSQLALNQIIEIFGGGIRTLTDDVQSISNESSRLQDTVDTLTRSITSLEQNSIMQNVDMEIFKDHSQSLLQEIQSLSEKIDDTTPASYDGTLVWRITNVQKKLSDAQSERQTSIYSPPFCSSQTGYKMRGCLFPFGYGNARGTHMSLFFVLMQSKNDAILKFPFNYKVTFGLFDQSDGKKHIVDSFRPDTKSNSFQRPRSKMNIPSGIPKFCLLDNIIKDNSPYVRGDTMFIKITVDFIDLSDDMQCYALSLNPGIPNHRQHQLIQQEIGKRNHKQSTTSNNA